MTLNKNLKEKVFFLYNNFLILILDFQESETQSPRFQSKGNLKQIDKSVQDYNENIEKNIEKESFNERNEDNNKINNSLNSEEDFIETKYNNVKEQYINYLKNEISKRQNSLLRLTDLLKKSESEIETSNSLLSIKKENKQIEKSPTLNNKQSSLSLIYDKYIKKSDENKIYSEKPSRQLSISSNPAYSRDRSTKIPDQSIDKCENSLKKLSLKLDQCLSKETNVIPKIFYDELESVRTINERSLIVNTMQSEICSEIKNENLNSILKESNKKTIEGVSTIRSFINEPDFPQNKSINHKNETNKQEYNNYNNNNNSPYIEKPKIKKLVYENGEYYEGECIGTLRHGYGTCYSNAGKPIYQGEWAEDLYNGHGVKFNNSLNINGMKESTFYQDFNKVKNCWVKYEGNFLKGKKNGSGILVFLNNEYFQGSFLNDKIQGKGSFQTKFGKRVIGEWQNNKLVHKIN